MLIRPWKSKKVGLDGLLEEWLGDILKDPKFTRDVLLDHIIHHVEEGKREGISASWLASMENLMELLARQGDFIFKPSVEKRLERLYQHWQQDPQGMTPPPQLKSFSKVIELERQLSKPKERYVRAEPS